jgi:hypothetical protein
MVIVIDAESGTSAIFDELKSYRSVSKLRLSYFSLLVSLFKSRSISLGPVS